MAVSLVEAFKVGPNRLEAIEMVPSSGGCYEITVDGKEVYSKLATGKHIADADAIALIQTAVAS